MSDRTPGPYAKRPIQLDELEGRATISVEEAGRLIGLSKVSAYAAAHRGDFPVRRIGRRMIVPVPALLAFLAEGDR